MNVQCDAIRWEQFLRVCRLGQLYEASRDKGNILDQIYKTKYVRIYIMKILNFESDGGKCILKEIQHITARNS